MDSQHSSQGGEVTLRVIDPDREDALYQAERRLRAEVLAAPVGLPEAELFPFELSGLSIHLLAFTHSGSRDPTGSPAGVVGCVLFHPDGKGSGRLYQMAVAPEARGAGLGRRLVRALEEELRERGLVECTLHARLHASGFYEKLGYSRVGEEYMEVGIPHVNMARSLL